MSALKKKDENKILHFKCSWAMINTPLSKFSKMFSLPGKKEIFPYNLFSESNILLKSVSIKEAITHLHADDIDEFRSNIKQWNLECDDGKFDHIKYSEIYCKQDVKLTKDGFNVFRGWCLEQLSMDSFDYMTLASMSDAYLRKEGCYEGVYKMSGIPRMFIQKTVKGGRVMSKDNKMYNLSGHDGDLFDAVSLYPSAMVRKGEDLGGFLKGKPKVILQKDLTYSFISKQDGYFVEIDILEVGINRSFPIVSNYKNNKCNYENDSLGITYVSKIDLEDMIKFQQIKFVIKSGYYFNEGRNNTIEKVMKFLFNQRLLLKKEKNPAEQIYKLIMNSSYGKTCLKEIDTDIQILKKPDFDAYLKNNYQYVIYYIKVPGCDLIKVKSTKATNDHFNSCHVGSEILGMSKRIMNEVMCTAEDEGIDVYYQDTDSIHLDADKVESLASIYKTKYNKELIGKNLGQFHPDFDFKSDKHVVSVGSIILGKKSYIDKVRIHKGDEITYDYHMRMKGIPTKCLNKVIEKDFEGDPMKLYKYLYDGNVQNFNLLEGTVCFEAMKNYEIETRTEFHRTVHFV